MFFVCRTRIKKLLSHLAEIYNSKEMENFKGIQQLQEDINDLLKENNIEEDSLRLFKGMEGFNNTFCIEDLLR